MAKKQKLNLVEELTTYKGDFQIWHTQPVATGPLAMAREEPLAKMPPPFVKIDPQSHAPYRSSAYVPFDLYLEPKPIVGTNPRTCFELRKPSSYSSSFENPNLSTILSPALPLDEVDEEDLEKILKYSYTGMHKIFMEVAALRTSKLPNPPNRVVNEGNNISFKPNLYPALPPGWVAAAKHWDCLQNRSLGDPFKTFWARRGPEVECGCCCNPLPNMLSKEIKEEIRNLIFDDKLRLPYDITKTGYGGYRQICARGVPLEKSTI